MKRLGKRGSAEDVLLLSVIVFAIAIGMFIFSFTTDKIVDGMLANSVVNSSTPTRNVFTAFRTVDTRFDYIVFGTFIGLVLALVISSWLVGGHPVFMFVYFLVLVIAIIMSVFMSNTWETMTTSSVFGSTINNFPLSNNIMVNLPYYLLVVGFLGMIIMFGKPYSGGGNL